MIQYLPQIQNFLVFLTILTFPTSKVGWCVFLHGASSNFPDGMGWMAWRLSTILSFMQWPGQYTGAWFVWSFFFCDEERVRWFCCNMQRFVLVVCSSLHRFLLRKGNKNALCPILDRLEGRVSQGVAVCNVSYWSSGWSGSYFVVLVCYINVLEL